MTLSYNDLIDFADNLNTLSVQNKQDALENLLNALVRNTTDTDYAQYVNNFENIISPKPVDSNCGSAVGYYWELAGGQFGNYLNSTAWQSRYKDITFPGKCVKRYLGNQEGGQITTKSGDPYSTGTNLGDDTYSCLPYGTVLAETKFPSTKTPKNQYIISEESDVSINRECARNPINYGGNWDDNNGYVNSKGATNPGESTGAKGGPPGVTRNCEVKKLISKYVWKGDFEDNSLINECPQQYPLYPGDNEAATMDVPSDNVTQWWKDNSCIWIHLLKTDNSLASTYDNRYYEPAVLNGKCGFGDFTIDDPKHNFKDLGSNASGAIDIDTSTNEENSLNVALTHDELIQGLKKQGYSDSDINSLLTDTDERITPFYQLPKPLSLPEADKCSWVPNDDIIQAGNGNPLVLDVPDVSDSFNMQDITGKIKKYAKDLSNRPLYSYPSTIGSNNIVLDNVSYRAYGYFDDNNDTMASDCQNLNNLPKPFNFTTQSSDIKWLSGSDVNKINEGSNLISNDPRIKINLDNTVLTDKEGVGSGECWQKVELTSVPNYVQYKAPVKGVDNPLFEPAQIKMSDPQITRTEQSPENIQNELLLKHIPSYGSANEELIYKNMALMNDFDNVFFKRNPEDCASADNDVIADSIGSLKYAWINKIGSA